ncbi:MAG: site-specific integrase, partial [Zoogloeaceae bacterium]|nr:site-specific integrase [Zoogloeaceae bacterium]
MKKIPEPIPFNPNHPVATANAAKVNDWLAVLADQRRQSPLTIKGYTRDLAHLLKAANEADVCTL